MKYKKIVIVGRSNVGKSTLFNRICKKRISIEASLENVTNNSIDWCVKDYGVMFTDTAGTNFQKNNSIDEEVISTTNKSIAEGDVIVFVVDGTVGVTVDDKYIARNLQKLHKNVILAINKCDPGSCKIVDDYEFSSLGIKDVVKISATHGAGIKALLTLLQCSKNNKEENSPTSTKIAIVGKTNAGKSELFNALVGTNKSLVNAEAGTTRDCIAASIENQGKIYDIVDTAGIQKHRSETSIVDKFAKVRTKNAIESCQICLLVIDATIGITNEDKKILDAIDNSNKCCILIFNKWDLISDTEDNYTKTLLLNDQFLKSHYRIFTSATSKLNVDRILQIANKITNTCGKKIPTSQLNSFLESIQKDHKAANVNGKRLKIYYIVHYRNLPPSFMLFVNNKKLFKNDYKRYIVNRLKEKFSLQGIPLVLKIQKSKNTPR